MTENFLDFQGEPVSADALSIPRAAHLAELLAQETLSFATLVECRKLGESAEAVVFDVEPSRPQITVHPIRRIERIAVAFQREDRFPPEVLALRQDFPIVSHLNLRLHELPRSLCLYEKSWDEVKLRWTPASFVEQIRYWLSETARGTLHQEDQSLEPLLLGSGYDIVVPADLSLSSDAPDLLSVVLAEHDDKGGVLLASRASEHRDSDNSRFVATAFSCSPQQHGLIRFAPANLEQLHEFCISGGIDLLSALRERFGSWEITIRDQRKKPVEAPILKARLVLIISFPKTRTPDAPPESNDIWAFLTERSLRETGIDIGLWSVTDGNLGRLVPADENKRGVSTKIDVVNVHRAFSPSAAALLNGQTVRFEGNIVCVGAGALGSQVVMNLARSGFGRWTIVDQDYLFPHNLARHALPRTVVGFAKATGLAFDIVNLFDDHSLARNVVADVLNPKEKAEDVSTCLADAELILDMSASVPVARYLARDCEANARRLSLFLSPSGRDLILLAEDKGRTIPLDALEIQYYRALIQNEILSHHLTDSIRTTRYAQSCRDRTSTMSQEQIALHAAIASRQVRETIRYDPARISVWRSDLKSGTVEPVSVAPVSIHLQQLGDWRLIWDEHLADKVADLRANKLPNETGGVLIGSYDLARRIVYVCDTIPSPPDSEEWPTLYIRGCVGLAQQVDDIKEKTAGNLEYVGEWHSHPDGCSCSPSGDDLKVFAWLTQWLSTDSLPALMLIAGHGDTSRWYLGQMLRDAEV